MNGLPAIPKVGSKISAATVAEIERKVIHALATIEDIEALEDVRAKAAALEVYVRDKALRKPMMGAQRRTEARIGQLLPAEKGGRGKTLTHALKFERPNDISDFRLFARLMEEFTGDEAPSDDDWRRSRRALVKYARERLGLVPETPDLPEGEFSVIVIDPPWPIEKIERYERPRQQDVDYHTLSVEQIGELMLPAAADCHLWCWTTHRFLPAALGIVDGWGFSYVCTFVWHKPGGFQPVGLPQYNCEFAVYGRKGSPEFVTTKDMPVCFEAPRGKHSEKPEKFYEMLRRCTTGNRIDMYNRREIEGFTGWGDEAA